MVENVGLRERKKRRTRRALIDAALELFADRGYDETTITEITAAADVSRRTFFAYFRSKDDLLFADADERLEALHASFAETVPGERPFEALRRITLDTLPQAADEILGRHRDARLQVLMTRPELRARCVQRMLDAERQMAAGLHAAFPDELSEHQAVAVTGAIIAVAMRTMEDPGATHDRLRANLLWTLGLLKGAMESYDRPPA
ncbi:TetR/AcrR family transcriptional regulator [Actinomadura sp. 3N508]|uniref:TetR/AcrR family transcriptional regulator n=1 Tax=Actinomadura sp. 3N508 TaxID=3375153 RepID=UPI00378E6D4A